jgi:hypothetical protein
VPPASWLARIACRARATSRRSFCRCLRKVVSVMIFPLRVDVVGHPAGRVLAGEPQLEQAAAERPGMRQPQRGHCSASRSNARSAMALSLLSSVAYQCSTSGEISTVQRGWFTGRVSHVHYIAFTQ